MSKRARSTKVAIDPLLPVEPAGVDIIAKFFRALGDQTRLRLLEYLLTDEHTVSDCVAHVNLSQGRVSSHLSCLASCGFVTVRREGRFAYYRAVDERVADLVRVARGLAAENADALASCIRIDVAR